MNSRAARSLRGAAFAAIATIAAAVAHTIGGGGAPSPLFCLALAALVLPLTVALSGPRVRAWRTWAALGAAQLAFHLAFAVTGDAAGVSPGAIGGHAHHGAWAMSAGESAAMAPSSPMALTHFVAAAITVLAVRHGENAVLRVLRWIRHVLPRVGTPLLVSPVRRPTPRRRRTALPTRRLAHLPLSRRGPPAPGFAATV